MDNLDVVDALHVSLTLAVWTFDVAISTSRALGLWYNVETDHFI